MREEKSKKCLNPWFKFLAILCVAVLTVLAIFEFEVKFNNKNRDLKSNIPRNERKRERVGDVLIASSGDNLKSPVAVQFETCRNFIVVNPSTEKYVSYPNDPNHHSLNNIKSYSESSNVGAVITGTMNIATYQMFRSLDVEVYTGVTGNAKDALKMYKAHRLASAAGPNDVRKNNQSLKDTKLLTF